MLLPPPSGAEPHAEWMLPPELPLSASGVGGIIPWAGADGADARLRKLVPLLLRNNPSNWALIATHLPGRSGRECQDRWVEITRIEAERHCASLSSPRSASLATQG